MPPKRYVYYDLICYALNIGKWLQDSKPAKFKEAFKSKDSKKLLKVLNDNMNSLMKNHIWELVRLHKRQRVVVCYEIFKK